MKRALLALCLLLLLWGVAQGAAFGRFTERFEFDDLNNPKAAETSGVGYYAVVTGYSCADRQDNPMRNCGLFRNGESPFDAHTQVGTFACPVEWLGLEIEVERVGRGVCRDTPARGWYGDAPHIDIYFGSDYGAHDEAILWGLQRGVRVWLLE